jgi:UMP-CMP kinase
MTHLSAGELLRQEMNTKSDTSSIINTCILSGKIVPVEITCGLLKRKIFTQFDSLNMHSNQVQDCKFIIDGFPRNLNNVEGWISTVGNSVTLIGTLIITCKLEEIQRRLMSRKRHDDSLEIISKRMETYENETKTIYPILSSLAPIVEVDGNTDEINVFDNIKEKLKGLI